MIRYHCRYLIGNILVGSDFCVRIKSLTVDLSKVGGPTEMLADLLETNPNFPQQSMTEPISTESVGQQDSCLPDSPVYRESHIRTILKTLSWRIVATTTTIVIAYFVFGDISSALAVGGIEFFAKMVIYYVHERIWQLAPRGSVRTIIHR